MRVHTTSSGLDPAELRDGADVVLELDEAHGVDAPAGVLVDDYLSVEVREELDAAAVTALARWRAHYDELLTVEGVCLPFVREWPLLRLILPTARAAAGLSRAVERHRPRSFEVMDSHPHTHAVIAAVAKRAGVDVIVPEGAAAPARTRARWRPEPLGRRLRRRVLRLATALGAPSLLRRDSVLIVSYWPLIPLLDRMLSDRGSRPAILLAKRPTGPRRILRTAMRGGWVGLPRPRRALRAPGPAAQALDAARSGPTSSLDLCGLPLGGLVHARALDLLRAGAGADLADAEVLRRAMSRGRATRLVAGSVVDPDTRLIVSVAGEAGIRTLLLAHGAYLLPQPLVDMELGDELALWSWSVAPPLSNRDRPIHVVGYPLPHAPPPTRELTRGRDDPTVVVLGQNGHPYTSTIDARVAMQQYTAAIRAVAARFPRAAVVLRPHPSADLGPLGSLVDRFPSMNVEIDATGAILELLGRADLCIGGSSAATLQAALVGTPVIVLNLSGFDWPWPIGGGTTVPVARSDAELRVSLDRWASTRTLPGRDDLLEGLGAHGSDATEHLLRILELGAFRRIPASGSSPA